MNKPIKIVVDMGSSQTRVLWSTDDTIHHRTFAAACSMAAASQTAERMDSNSFLVQRSKDSYVVGHKAAENPFVEDAIDAQKVDGTIYRILAALHIVVSAVEEEDPPLSLIVLLPSDEHRSFKLLEKALRTFGRSFRCNGVAHNLNLNSIACLAEGYGILRYMVSLYEESWGNTNILTTIAGYRDMSLIASKGFHTIVKAKTARLGLLWLIKDIEEEIGTIDRLEAARILYELGEDAVTSKSVARLVRVRLIESMKSQDATMIAQAMRASRKKYLDFVCKALQAVKFPYDVMLLCGGTGDYLSSHVSQTISDRRIITPEPLINRIIKEYGFEKADAVRLADVFAIAFMQQTYKEAVLSA